MILDIISINIMISVVTCCIVNINSIFVGSSYLAEEADHKKIKFYLVLLIPVINILFLGATLLDLKNNIKELL